MLYALPDCHGRLDLVSKLYQAVLDDIERIKDPKGSQIIFVGDFIDRGRESKGVLDFVMNLKDSDSIKHIFLLGNHEDLMIQGFNGSQSHWDCWMGNGGRATLSSFGIELPYYEKDLSALKPYVEWMEKLPFYYTIYDYIFCHSGYVEKDLSIPLDDQKQSLIWERPNRGRYTHFDKWVICGHTPGNGKPYMEYHFVNVDSGGWYGNLHTLWAVALPHGECLENDPRFIQIKL